MNHLVLDLLLILMGNGLPVLASRKKKEIEKKTHGGCYIKKASVKLLR